MAHPTRIKIKRGGVYVDVEDLPALRQQAESKPRKLPKVNVAGLPELSALDEDTPFAQLFYEHRAVRAYVTENCEIRKGLKPSERKTAERILRKYGGKP